MVLGHTFTLSVEESRGISSPSSSPPCCLLIFGTGGLFQTNAHLFQTGRRAWSLLMLVQRKTTCALHHGPCGQRCTYKSPSCYPYHLYLVSLFLCTSKFSFLIEEPFESKVSATRLLTKQEFSNQPRILWLSRIGRWSIKAFTIFKEVT